MSLCNRRSFGGGGCKTPLGFFFPKAMLRYLYHTAVIFKRQQTELWGALITHWVANRRAHNQSSVWINYCPEDSP